MKERLQKIISAAGIASRRKAEALILEGKVVVNGKVVKELGTKADLASDRINIGGKYLNPPSRRLYIALHKPAGYISTLHDPQGRKTVKDLFPSLAERVFPIGRLDYASEGLLLMTNDGDFAFRVGHPKFRITKHYLVKISGKISDEALKRLQTGIALEDGDFRALEARHIATNPKSMWLLLVINEGRNRIIRRALAVLDVEVKRLIRVAIGAVVLDGIKAGEHRFLSPQEVASFFE